MDHETRIPTIDIDALLQCGRAEPELVRVWTGDVDMPTEVCMETESLQREGWVAPSIAPLRAVLASTINYWSNGWFFGVMGGFLDSVDAPPRRREKGSRLLSKGHGICRDLRSNTPSCGRSHRHPDWEATWLAPNNGRSSLRAVWKKPRHQWLTLMCDRHMTSYRRG